ncbi:MAG TPA: hypothetical protein VIY90_15080 [Steroidobacteraceae bacterium]
MRTLLALASIVAMFCALTRSAAAFPVTVKIDASKPVGVLPPIWRFFGADEPNYATRPAGEKLLMELGRLRPGRVYFRAHNLMTSGDGTPSLKWGSTNIYTVGNGKPVYDFTIVDHIIDTYLARGIHPYLEIGFMPEAMSSAPAGAPYHRLWRAGVDYKGAPSGWSYPPRDYRQWAELIYQWTRHNVERYGSAEVQRWYFEVWNEPNLDFYWAGTPEDFYRLHDYGIDAVRRALPGARVGGPDLAGSGAFLEGFLQHITTGTNYATGKIGTPSDFLSFHAKGQPVVLDGHVRMDIAKQLKTADEAFDRISAVPQLAHSPIIIGENDPEGCAACPGPENAYRNGTMYSSYTAAIYPRLWELARRKNVNLEGALTWAFTFVGQPWFAGYRQLATNGVDLPVLNVFRLFARLDSTQVEATSSSEVPLTTMLAEGVRSVPDVGVLATRAKKDGRVAILLWHYRDDDVAGPVAEVKLVIGGLGPGLKLQARVWRIDRQSGDAFTAWKAMGAPTNPSRQQIDRLLDASRMLARAIPLGRRANDGSAILETRLPLQGVQLVEVRRMSTSHKSLPPVSP